MIRNLEGIARRRGRAGQIGQCLVRLARLVVRVVHHYQRGLLSDESYRQRLVRLRRALQAQLRQGSQYAHQPRTQRQCQALRKDEPLLWTFVGHPGLPLTNNLAERTLRGYVIWRKTSFFTQSIRGLAFRPMMLSVVITAQRLGLNPYRLLRQICEQGLRGKSVDVRLPLPQQLLPAPP